MGYDELTYPLFALGNPTRMGMVRLLIRSKGHGCGSGELAAELKIPATTASTHLSILRRSGLVKRVEVPGTKKLGHYRLDHAELESLAEVLQQISRGGHADWDFKPVANV